VARFTAGDGPAAARAYIIAHDARAVRVDRMADISLRLLWLACLRNTGAECLMGGPQNHDELVNGVVDLEFPDVAEARRVYYEWVDAKMPAVGQE